MSRWTVRVLLAVACGNAIAAAGCSSRMCGDKGCLSPIAFAVPVHDTAPGKYQATFCKARVCESATLEIPDTLDAEVEKTFHVRFGLRPKDVGLEVSVEVLSAPSFDDGEALAFTFVNASGESLVDWTAVARYEVHEVNGPGCGECQRLDVPLPSE